MRRMLKSMRDQLGLVTCLLVAAQGCVVEEGVTSQAVDDADASVPELDDKANASLDQLATEELVRRVSVLPDKKVVVFDFDDTLYDHVEGSSSRWASYAKSAITHLKQRSVNIAVCSRNKNSSGALNRKLRELDSQVFNDAFFKSPAFQADSGLDKWDDIQQIMAYFGVKREDHVVFFDDDPKNIAIVGAASDAVIIPVEANGIDRDEFREGMIELLEVAAGGGTGGGTTSCNGQCSSACPCQVGQGDCDSNADCASGLVCPPDGAGSELCMKPTSGGSTTSCNGQCSSACPCQVGQGDCDSNADCASGLVCPPDGAGSELCMKPTSGGGTTSCNGQCSSTCPCQEGQGDCDSNADCASGLVCPADGAGSELCMKPTSGGSTGGGTVSGSGNLRVLVGSRWVSVGCGSGAPRADGSSDKWTIVDRRLRNQNGVYLYCAEGWSDGRDCECSKGSSEAYHAITQADFNASNTTRKYGNGLTDSLAARGPLYLFPNNGHEFCLTVGSNNIIENKDGGDDGTHQESTHASKCNQWCVGSGCP